MCSSPMAGTDQLGLDTLLAIDDFDAGASTIAVSGSAAEDRGGYRTTFALLDLQIALNIRYGH